MSENKKNLDKKIGGGEIEKGQEIEIRLEQKGQSLEKEVEKKDFEQAKLEKIKKKVKEPNSQIENKEKKPLTQQIENIMSEDLTDLFLDLSSDKQKEFQTKGEVTASLIQEMVDQAKINVKKIFNLIREWLKVIPGVNKIFLEQEAKIKTDKILALVHFEKM